MAERGSHIRARRVAAWLVAAAAAFTAPLALSCDTFDEADVRRGHTRFHRVTLLESRGRVRGLAARYEDWILENDSVRVLVGGLGRRADERGAILEIRARGTDDDEAVVHVVPSVHVGQRRFRVSIESIRVLVRDRRPHLRLAGSVEAAPGSKLLYSSELTLDEATGIVGIRSRVAIAEGRAEVRLGRRVLWGGRDPFVPGPGFVSDPHFREAPFVAVEGESTATVLARVDRPAHVGAVFEAHGTERMVQFTEVVDRARTISAEHAATEHSLLAIAEGGMNDALRAIGFVRGEPYREAHADLPYAPPGAIVRVRTLDGRLVLIARPGSNGHARIPLPRLTDAAPGFSAAATARGHAGGAAVRFAEGDRIALDIPRGGSIRVSARDRSNRQAIPARARFIPERGHAPVELGPDSSADGAKDSVILRDGDAIVPLPKGRYRVLVTHGPEWTLHDETVEVTETFRPDVRAVLDHVVDPGAWVPCDLHVHSAPSPDSQVSLDDRVRSLVAEGIEFAVPTDHNHVSDFGPSARSIGGEARGFLTVPGVEATTWDPAFGHFNAYPVTVDPNAPHGGAPHAIKTHPADLFAAMRALSPDAIVQVNHPRSEGGIGYFDVERFDPATGTGSAEFSDDFDALEVWNGFDLARPALFDRVFGDFVVMAARGVHVTAVGNSDSHQVRYQWAGYPRTYVRAEAREPAAIVAGIREGRAFVTSGPFLEVSIDDRGPGEVVSARAGAVTLRVRVRTAPWMKVDRLEVYLNATKLVTESLPAPRRRRNPRAPQVADVVERSLSIRVERDAALIVVVRGSETLDDYFGRASIPPLAFTNPIWVDGDGDGEGPRDPRVRPTREPDAGVDADGGFAGDAAIDRDR